jgi:ferredoxin
LGNTDILPIAALLNHKEIPDEYDRIGFCSPSYYSHVPPFVIKCLSGVKYRENQIVFSVIGCVGNRGLAVEDIRETVEASGKSVKYEFTVMYPGSFILSYNAFPMFYQKLVLRQSDKKIIKIANILKAGGTKIQIGKSFLITKKLDEQVKPIISNFGNEGKKYKVSKNCIKCGRCVRVCPVSNIMMDESGVKFGDDCQQCMSCIQWCPKRAIDKDRIAEKRNRYHHPAIKAEDIEKNNLKISL